MIGNEETKWTYHGGPYDSERYWEKDWHWCICNMDEGRWPGEHPIKNHQWNKDRLGYLKKKLGDNYEEDDEEAEF